MSKKKGMSFEDFKDKNKPFDSGEKILSEKSDSKKISGIVIIVTEKGYGFIKCKDYEKLFFHFNDVDNKNLVKENTEVEFEIGIGKDGRDAAQKVKILSKQISTQEMSTENQEEVKMPEYYLPQDTLINIQLGKIDNLGLLLNKCAKFDTSEKDAKKHKFSFYNKTTKKSVIEESGFKFYDNLIKKINSDLLSIATVTFGENNLKNFKLDIDWRMVVGLGTESVYETSMTLHPIYGFPYIPGQAIKGITRSWVVNEKYGGNEGKAIENEEFCKIFGCPKEMSIDQRNENGELVKDNKGKVIKKSYKNSLDTKKDFQGAVIFFDAFPTSSPNMKVDVMNPHYAPYYSATDNTPPADYYNPVPIYFLTVEKTSFQFIIGIKEKHDCSLLEKAEKYLREALLNQGIGAKSAVGYGYFNEVKNVDI